MSHAQRGMSLLELLVVVAILCVVVVATMPDFVTWRRDAEYRHAAREVLGIMRLARSRAISRNLEQHIEFETVNRRYRLMEGDRPNESSVFTTTVVDWITLPPEVALKQFKNCSGDGDRTLEFNPNGTSQSGYICIVEAAAPEVYHFRVGVPSSYIGRPIILEG